MNPGRLEKFSTAERAQVGNPTTGTDGEKQIVTGPRTSVRGNSRSGRGRAGLRMRRAPAQQPCARVIFVRTGQIIQAGAPDLFPEAFQRKYDGWQMRMRLAGRTQWLARS